MSYESGPQSPDVRISDLRRRVVAEPGLQAELLALLERKGLSGAIVPVEVSHPADEVGPQQPAEQRWVEWKRVYRPKTAEELAISKDDKKDIEIPGSIEKILRVKLRNAPLGDLISDGQYSGDVHGQIYNTRSNVDPGNFDIEDSEGDVELVMLVFDDFGVSTGGMLTWLEANELRGSTLKELLAINAQFPEEKRRVKMVALGQNFQFTSESPALVPIVAGFDRERDLDLERYEGPWFYNVHQFPAARKPASQ